MSTSRRDRPSRRPHVILVEPHGDTCELYLDCFARAGTRLTAVPSAADALRMVRQHAPDVLITCLCLPDMDGFGLCEAIRAMPHALRLPVIAISSCQPDHERAARDARFGAVLMKPCSPDALLDAQRQALAAPYVRPTARWVRHCTRQSMLWQSVL